MERATFRIDFPASPPRVTRSELTPSYQFKMHRGSDQFKPASEFPASPTSSAKANLRGATNCERKYYIYCGENTNLLFFPVSLHQFRRLQPKRAFDERPSNSNRSKHLLIQSQTSSNERTTVLLLIQSSSSSNEECERDNSRRRACNCERISFSFSHNLQFSASVPSSQYSSDNDHRTY